MTTADLPPLPVANRMGLFYQSDMQAYAKLAVREALERAKSKGMVYELHNEMIVKAVPFVHIDAIIKEYE